MKKRAQDGPTITPRLDRVVINSMGDLASALDRLDDFRTIKDFRRKKPKGNEWPDAYRRVRHMVNARTGTKLFIDYQPSRNWRLAPLRVAIVPEDLPGLRRKELERVMEAFAPCRFALVEIAVDVGRRTQ